MSTGTSIALVALLAVFTTGCASTQSPAPSTVKTKTASAPLRPVPKLDLPRFMGDWRVIAKLPKHGYDPAQFMKVPQLPSQMAWLH